MKLWNLQNISPKHGESFLVNNGSNLKHPKYVYANKKFWNVITFDKNVTDIQLSGSNIKSDFLSDLVINSVLGIIEIHVNREIFSLLSVELW